jgi:hypothetical protein
MPYVMPLKMMFLSADRLSGISRPDAIDICHVNEVPFPLFLDPWQARDIS